MFLSHVLILLVTLKLLSAEAETRAMPPYIEAIYTFPEGISCLSAFCLKLCKLLIYLLLYQKRSTFFVK